VDPQWVERSSCRPRERISPQQGRIQNRHPEPQYKVKARRLSQTPHRSEIIAMLCTPPATSCVKALRNSRNSAFSHGFAGSETESARFSRFGYGFHPTLPMRAGDLPGSPEFRGRKFVPVGSTNVGFTPPRENHTLSVSSSGGGLFGRPATRKSSGRFLFGLCSSSPQVSAFTSAM
jgi:hypothetical protein